MKIKWIYPITIVICLSVGSLGWAHGGGSGGSASSGGSTSGSTSGHGSTLGHGSTVGHAATHGGMSFGHHGGLASLNSHSHFRPTPTSNHTPRNLSPPNPRTIIPP